MPKSFVLMTAMPPTKGHLGLIRFAHSLTGKVRVIVCTQPDEPYVEERYWAIVDATRDIPGVSVYSHPWTVPQEPEQMDGFWDMWKSKLSSYGFEKGDYLVSSETYGKDMADALEGVYMPYDLGRWVNSSKATRVREDLDYFWEDILPEFSKYLRKTITIFGAESVGKTTTTYFAGDALRATIVPEWARPYLETVGSELTVEKMNRIREGQKALQKTVREISSSRFILQDTDLFSTVGYWEMWDRDSMPESLLRQARRYKSDLYVILSSDIEFQSDPLRYGGNERETSDQYWINLCERENLQYVYVRETFDRHRAVVKIVRDHFNPSPLTYHRSGREYERST